MSLGLSPEELFEELRGMLVNDAIVWLSIEEAKVWGFNCIYYTIRVEPHLPGAAAAFEFVTSIERLIPIAIVFLLPKDVDLGKLTALSRELNIFVFGGGESYGALVPLDEESIGERVRKATKRVLETVANARDFEPLIDGYYLDLITA